MNTNTNDVNDLIDNIAGDQDIITTIDDDGIDVLTNTATKTEVTDDGSVEQTKSKKPAKLAKEPKAVKAVKAVKEQKVVKEPKVEVEKEAKEPTKADLARAIFKEHYGNMERKDIIALFISQADLTIKGAATYYQNFTAQLKKEATELLNQANTNAVDQDEDEEVVENELVEA